MQTNQQTLTQDQTVRFQLAMGAQGRLGVDALIELFDWVMGPKTNILPVSKFQIVDGK